MFFDFPFFPSQIAYGSIRRANIAHSSPKGVTLATEQMLAQWIATVFWLIAQMHATALKNIESALKGAVGWNLATIALDVIFPVLEDYTNNLAKFLFGNV